MITVSGMRNTNLLAMGWECIGGSCSPPPTVYSIR